MLKSNQIPNLALEKVCRACGQTKEWMLETGSEEDLSVCEQAKKAELPST